MSPGNGPGALAPAPFEALLGWALDGLARDRSVYGLPKRSFWTGDAGLDLSVEAVGGRVGTPLGIAAGPHTQLAHNLVAGWLAGAEYRLEEMVAELNESYRQWLEGEPFCGTSGSA